MDYEENELAFQPAFASLSPIPGALLGESVTYYAPHGLGAPLKIEDDRSARHFQCLSPRKESGMQYLSSTTLRGFKVPRLLPVPPAWAAYTDSCGY